MQVFIETMCRSRELRCAGHCSGFFGSAAFLSGPCQNPQLGYPSVSCLMIRSSAFRIFGIIADRIRMMPMTPV